jgi:hypothetical protein
MDTLLNAVLWGAGDVQVKHLQAPNGSPNLPGAFTVKHLNQF